VKPELLPVLHSPSLATSSSKVMSMESGSLFQDSEGYQWKGLYTIDGTYLGVHPKAGHTAHVTTLTFIAPS
jgi:putative methionine-R-sulfoxide reductase with GAF domain